VHARHPGWAQRAVHLHRNTYTAEQVIVAAHAYGSSKLLLTTRRLNALPERSNAACGSRIGESDRRGDEVVAPGAAAPGAADITNTETAASAKRG
jgi:hypothetical protein